jgi:hypothetical protein
MGSGLFAVTNGDQQLRIWNIETQANFALEVPQESAEGDVVVDMSFSPQRQCFAGRRSSSALLFSLTCVVSSSVITKQKKLIFWQFSDGEMNASSWQAIPLAWFLAVLTSFFFSFFPCSSSFNERPSTYQGKPTWFAGVHQLLISQLSTTDLDPQGPSPNFLAVVAEDSTIMLSEAVMTEKMSRHLVALQISPEKLAISRFRVGVSVQRNRWTLDPLIVLFLSHSQCPSPFFVWFCVANKEPFPPTNKHPSERNGYQRRPHCCLEWQESRDL